MRIISSLVSIYFDFLEILCSKFHVYTCVAKHFDFICAECTEVLCFRVKNEPDFCYAIRSGKPSLLSQAKTKVSLLVGLRSQTVVYW